MYLKPGTTCFKCSATRNLKPGTAKHEKGQPKVYACPGHQYLIEPIKLQRPGKEKSA